MIKDTKAKGKNRYLVYVCRRDKFKKRHQRKRYASNKPLALKLERELFQELENEINGKPSLTWRELLDIYSHEYNEGRLGKSADTFIGEIGSLEKHTTPKWASAQIREITRLDVENLVNDSIKSEKPATKKNLVKEIRNVFNCAVDRGYITKNPAAGIKYKIPRTIRSLPTPDEVKLLLRKSFEDGMDFRYLLAFGIFLGARSGELLALKWKSVDLARRQVTISESWSRRTRRSKPPKSGSHRVIPINQELLGILVHLKSVTYSNPDSDVIPRFRAWTNGEAAKEVKAYCLGLGIHPMTIHCCRRFFVTELLRSGESIGNIMDMTGHVLVTTLSLYRIGSTVGKVDATEPLGKLCNESGSSLASLEAARKIDEKNYLLRRVEADS